MARTDLLAWREGVGRAQLGGTDRRGGLSRPPYDGLNLAGHVGDDPAAVAGNRRRLAAALPAPPIAWMQQVHGRHVAVVTAAADPGPVADALVTTVVGLTLAVLVADCTPVLAADPQAGVVGVAHAGRRGLAAGVVPALLDQMVDLGATQVSVVLGPSICPGCYPVGEALREEVARAVPQAWAVDRHGRAALDVAAGVMAQAQAHPAVAGVRRRAGCPAEDPALYSYRRDGPRTGRFAGLAWLG